MSITKKIIILILILFVNCAALYPMNNDLNTGTLFLSTAPIRAYVSIDGSPLTEETPLIIHDITPGEHHIVIRKYGLKKHDLNINIESGEIRAIQVELKKDGTPNYSKDGLVYYDPVYPKQKTLDAARIAIPILVAVSGYFTISDIVYPKKTGLFVSPMTVTAYAATAGAISIKITLSRSKKNSKNHLHPAQLFILIQ